ncbi:MAG: hypothetical protein IT229_11060 [Flavobacteriales bacterium]|nr:hypothetical protein [Flavobacteriales bacterium]
MPRIALSLLLIFLFARSASAQNPEADSLLAGMRTAAGPSERIALLYKLLYEVPLLTQQQRIHYSKAIRVLSKEQGDKVMESVALAELGDLLAYNGDRLQGAELAYAAFEMAQEHGNEQALALILIDLSRCLEDRSKAMAHLHTALDLAKRSGDQYCTMWSYGNLCTRHSEAKQRDSALYYAQRVYDISMSENLEVGQTYSYGMLATTNYELYGEKGIAYEYLKKARASRIGRTHPEHFMGIHGLLGKYHLKDGRLDSALHYTDLMRTKQEYGGPSSVLLMYALYKDIYADRNSDSALKYFRLYDTMKDSIATMGKSQQLSLLLVKKEIELEQRHAARAQDLQFAFIAVGILAFVIIFLLLSRSVITNTRVISFLGVVALLIVFEFLNLLLHPFLEKVTHHSPALMLLALVCIAALLVPLHHKLEKWATAKLIEKNKAIRLTQAKKTIEQLEKQSP